MLHGSNQETLVQWKHKKPLLEKWLSPFQRPFIEPVITHQRWRYFVFSPVSQLYLECLFCRRPGPLLHLSRAVLCVLALKALAPPAPDLWSLLRGRDCSSSGWPAAQCALLWVSVPPSCQCRCQWQQIISVQASIPLLHQPNIHNVSTYHYTSPFKYCLLVVSFPVSLSESPTKPNKLYMQFFFFASTWKKQNLRSWSSASMIRRETEPFLELKNTSMCLRNTNAMEHQTHSAASTECGRGRKPRRREAGLLSRALSCQTKKGGRDKQKTSQDSSWL